MRKWLNRRESKRSRLWLIVTVSFLVVGIVGSTLGARDVARADAQTSRQAFVASSREVASTLQLALQHEQDLAVSAAAFVVGNPDASQADFLQWTSSVRAFARYQELVGIAELELITAPELSSFAARAVLDPVGPLGAKGAFQVIPGGARPYYCLKAMSQARAHELIPPAGIDYCKTSLGPKLLAARDSGAGAYMPFNLGKSEFLVVGTPIYRGGVAPSTVAARRAAFIGWTGSEILPSSILARALMNHPSTAVAFYYGTRKSAVSFTAGRAPAGAQSTTIDLGGGWHIKTFGTASGAGLIGNKNALALLVGGILLTVLLALLTFSLGTGRARALLLVNERTDQLRHLAFHDALTGLPNRALILDRIDHMLARARRGQTSAAALFLDLDNFKDVNDTLGHNVGDQLLGAVAVRLRGALREADTVGRLGGDEFVVLVENSSLNSGAEDVAARILRALRVPFEVPGYDLPLAVTASIGIATGDRVAPEDLLRDADIALYRAKDAGKQCSVVFTPSMMEAVEQHRNLEMDLAQALGAEQFFLVYQPIIDLRTGAISGVEALLRWRHPLHGVVQPDIFIPVLEASGLIVPVGKWVLRTACSQGQSWHNQGHLVSISVNVSAGQLEHNNIVGDVADVLSATGLDPAMLTLELTETALMSDVEGNIGRLEKLKASGVRVAIDDFGTGYSSLAYLRHFPIDVLKIDQSFVSEIAESPESMALVHTLVQLADVLGLDTVAEGIETEQQRVGLLAENVDRGQGFLFSRPLEIDALSALLVGPVGTPAVVAPLS